MITGSAARATATASVAGVLSLGTLTVLPVVPALSCAVVLAVCLVHRLAPARVRASHHLPSA